MNYDVIVIGGGPGGYVAAIKAAQLGGKVALVEKEKHLGGVCLNWGCIPTKALLKGARVYQEILKSATFGIEGINTETIKINWPNMVKRKDQVVKRLVGGVAGLMKKNGIQVIQGFAQVLDPHRVQVGDQILTGKKLILATGSHPAFPEIPGLKEAFEAGIVYTSKELMAAPQLPQSLIILGGGVIGIEFATLMSTLGVEVTVLEGLDRILASVDGEMAEALKGHLMEAGVKIVTGAKIMEIRQHQVRVEVQGEIKTYEGENILLSLGTRPNLKGLEALNLAGDHRGITTNERMETSVPGVYAIGDLNGKYMLAHVASAEGIVAATNAMGGKDQMNYRVIPACIYSFPELASVGLTEAEAKAQGYEVLVSRFPLSANGKALAEGESTGFVKVVAEKQYGEILGTHIMAVHATDMIAEAVVAMELEGTAEDVAKAIHPHPSLTEIVMEASHGILGKPIHI